MDDQIRKPKPGGQVFDEAARFLKLLDPEAKRFTFQTFDDDLDRKDGSLTRVIHGSLAENFEELCRLNDGGAGIFVTVNETDFKGRATANIVRIRALFSDLDGAPRPENFLAPSIEVETSEGRWHLYYRVSDVVDKDKFSEKQKGLAARFGSDPTVHDPPRVMRLPGFFHRKGEPRLVRIIGSSDAVYTSDQFPDPPKPVDGVPEHLRNYVSKGIGAEYHEQPSKWQKLNTEALAKISTTGCRRSSATVPRSTRAATTEFRRSTSVATFRKTCH